MYQVKWIVNGVLYVSDTNFTSKKDAVNSARKADSDICTYHGYKAGQGAWAEHSKTGKKYL
jgi:hypothetical protein